MPERFPSDSEESPGVYALLAATYLGDVEKVHALLASGVPARGTFEKREAGLNGKPLVDVAAAGHQSGLQWWMNQNFMFNPRNQFLFDQYRHGRPDPKNTIANSNGKFTK